MSAQQRSSASKLVLAVSAFYPDSYGGAERQAQILAEALGRRGVDVTMIAPTVSRDAPLLETTAFGRIIRKRLRAYPNLGGRNILSFLAWSLWVPWKLRGPQWAGVPVYIFHARLHAFGPTLAAMRNKSRLLVKLGGGGEASEFDALRSKKYFYGDCVEALLRRRVDIFVANSGQIAAELRTLGIPSDRIAEFPNGVALPPLAELEVVMARRTGTRFIYMGRLLPDKRVEVLFDATVAVAGAGEAMDLVLVGDGPEKDRLETQPIPVINGTASVQFRGFMADVYPELVQADFFFSASMREGQSNALLEAMSAGVIPVVYAASGVAEVVTDGVNGFVVEESGVDAFIGAARRALALDEAERRRMSLAARRFAEENIGIDAIAGRTTDFLEGR